VVASLRPLLLVLSLLASGCLGAGDGPPEVEDASSDAGDGGAVDCDGTLTYASFGKAFLDTYCNRCHGFTQQSAQLSGASISSAAGTSTFMPRGAPTPSADERRRLVAWLACGAP